MCLCGASCSIAEAAKEITLMTAAHHDVRQALAFVLRTSVI